MIPKIITALYRGDHTAPLKKYVAMDKKRVTKRTIVAPFVTDCSKLYPLHRYARYSTLRPRAPPSEVPRSRTKTYNNDDPESVCKANAKPINPVTGPALVVSYVSAFQTVEFDTMQR